jgi:hypothetical protein
MSGTQSPLCRKLFLLIREVGLTREERIELAQVILHRDITTYKGLDDEQIGRLCDALEGYEKITWLLTIRGDTTGTPVSDAPDASVLPQPSAS